MPTPFEEQVRLLTMVDILEPLSREELEKLARRCLDTQIERGEIFYTPWERGERFFFLKRGRVQVSPEGQELTLSVVEGGDILGEIALTDQRLSGVYVRALESSVVCILKRGTSSV